MGNCYSYPENGCCITTTNMHDRVEADINELKSKLKELSNLTTTIPEEENPQQQESEVQKIVQLLSSKVNDLEITVYQPKRKALHKQLFNDKLHPIGYCFKLRHKRSRKLQESEQDGGVSPVLSERKPEQVAEEKRTESKIVGLQPILDQVLRCVEREAEEEVGVIGLYGMGGVGKTTLLTQINQKLLQAKYNFDFVIWVEVSRDLRVDRIQEEIGKVIGLFHESCSWGTRTLKEKASDISNALEHKKFVLLLDDLWEKVDLVQVGVPLHPLDSSKIIFTTRRVEVCSLMEADIQLRVKCLEADLALQLLPICTEDGDKILSRRIVQKCGGLPLALTIVSQEMAKKRSQHWQSVYDHLRTSASTFPGMVKNVYSTLRLSYDGLQKDIFRTCLLHCCLFPSHAWIAKTKLIDYWIGEGFLDDRIGAQNQGYYIINVLLNACLLEEEFCRGHDCVRVHAVVNDMIMWIASEFEKEKRFFCIEEAPNMMKWKDKRRMSVTENNEILTKIPECPHLQTLFLKNSKLKNLSDGFFDSLPSLKVLNLSNNPNLNKLSSGISKLVFLQHLDLSGTGIGELLTEMKSLVNLKCLNLENTSQLKRIPRQLISSFSKLLVLRLLECSFLCQVPSDGAEWLIEELIWLKNLDMLSITLRSFHALQRLLSSHILQNCIQSLYLQFLHHPKSLKVSLIDLKHLNTLMISDCKSLEELKVDCAVELRVRESHCFCSLQVVTIRSCPKLKDLTWLILAPNLRSLDISDCSNMEEIINVGRLSEFPEMMGDLIPFSKLEFLTLKDLPKLMSIYWSDLPFPQLTQITIRECPKLTQITIRECPKLTQITIREFPKLIPSHSDKAKEPEIVEHKSKEVNIGFSERRISTTHFSP
ncbi:hypothetical protein ACOSQ4_030907 [Xanthoceras sorbifolium]